MPPPRTIAVKLSTEEASGAAVTAVVQQEWPLTQLVEQMLDLTGQHAERIAEILRRGTLVVGATRVRWTPVEVAPSQIGELLQLLPGPDPGRRWDRGGCFQVTLLTQSGPIVIARETGEARRWLQRRTFWDAVLDYAGGKVRYAGYSWRAKADRWTCPLNTSDGAAVHRGAPLLTNTALARRIQSAVIMELEFLVRRTV